MAEEKRAVRAGVFLGTCDFGHTFEMRLVKGEPFPPCPVSITGTELGSICAAPAMYEYLRTEELVPPGEES